MQENLLQCYLVRELELGQSGNENRDGLGMRLIPYLPCVAHASGRQTQTHDTGNCFDFCNLGSEKEEENDNVKKEKKDKKNIEKKKKIYILWLNLHLNLLPDVLITTVTSG